MCESFFATLECELLDRGKSSSRLVEQFREALGPIYCVRFGWDDRTDAAPACSSTIGAIVVAFIGDGGSRFDVRPEVERDLELSAVVDLAASQVEGDRQTVEVGLEVDLAGEPTARAAERLILLPPFAPAAETWARTVVLSNICTRWAVSLRSARSWKKASNTRLRLSRQNRFQMLFQLPNTAGRARQVRL